SVTGRGPSKPTGPVAPPVAAHISQSAGRHNPANTAVFNGENFPARSVQGESRRLRSMRTYTTEDSGLLRAVVHFPVRRPEAPPLRLALPGGEDRLIAG